MKHERTAFGRALLLVGAGILFYWALENYKLLASGAKWGFGVLWPLFLGFCIAFVLNIPMRFFESHLFRRTHSKCLAAVRRPLCILLSLAAIVGILAAVLCLVVPELAAAISVLGSAIPEFLTSAQNWASESASRYPEIAQWVDSLQLDWNETAKKLFAYATQSMGNVLGGTVSVVSRLVGSIFNATMAFIFGLYILLGKETLKRQTAHLCRAALPPRAAESLFFVTDLAKRTFAHFVTGQCTEACILGTLCWLGMLIFRLPYAPMIGALVGISALLPIVGGWIGLLVGAFMIGTESLTQAAAFVVFLLVLQQIEGNLIYPRVVGSSVGLPPIWVLAAVTVGGGMFGLTGMLFAVPVCSILYALTRLWTRRRLAERAAAAAAPPEGCEPHA